MNDERELARRAKAGDGEAFAGLVKLHQARLRALAARYVADADDVYDLVQDAFLDAFRTIERFDLEREFGPWMRTLAHNRVMSFLRDRATRREHHLALVDQALARQAEREDAQARATADDDRIAALQRCLGGLQDSHRLLVDMRYHRNVPVKELCERFGKSEGSIAMMLMRIRTALLRCLQGHGHGEAAKP